MKESIKKRIEAVRRGEVPEGYRFENGYLIPHEWATVLLNSRFSRSTRKNRTGCENVLTISAQMGLVNQREFYDKDIASEDKSGYFLMKNGEFAYNKSYSTGYPYGAIKQLTRYDEGIVSPLYICFAPKADTNTAFYIQYFESGRYNREIYRVAQEGARNHGLLNIAVEDFFSGVLVEPSASEQQKIAEILATCDRVIELKQQLLEEKRRQKKWLMQKLLDPTSGVQPQGCSGKWRKWRLRDLGIFSKGSGISNEDCSSGSCPCIKYGDIYVSYDEFFVDAISHTEDEVFDKAPLVHKGTLLFTGSGEDSKEIGKCTAYLGDEPIAVGGDIIVMKPNEAVVNPLFLAYALNSYSAIKQKAYLGQGYSVVHIYGEDIKKISVDIPVEMETQEEIAEIIMTSNRENHLIENEIASWQQKKKALMQLLLTGLVRVNA